MPGVKLNFSKRGVSTTLGVKGARYTMGSGGRRTASVGIPGTGISYVTTQNKHAVKKVITKYSWISLQNNNANTMPYAWTIRSTSLLCWQKRNWYTLAVLCRWFYYWLDNRYFGNIEWKLY